MFSKIILIIIIIIVLANILDRYDTVSVEKFTNSKNLNNRFTNKNLNSKPNTNPKPNLNTQQITDIDESILFNNKDYNENLSIDNKNNKYYYDDMINQSDINETSFNVVYSIDPIDYADVKTGATKCDENCKGICFENGYDGIATCYPSQQNTFDWGTLYKNPTFTYGYNAYGPENLPQ
jgi:hypothetical protein